MTFESGSVTHTVTITYTPQTTPTQGNSSLAFAGLAFQLTAADANGNPVAQFSKPYTLTIRYAESDWQNAGITDESQLNLAYWDGSAWVNVPPCAGCSLNTTTNTLVARLDHFTDFALFGPTGTKLFLPLIRR